MKRKESKSVSPAISELFNALRSDSTEQDANTSSKVSDFQTEIASMFCELYPDLREHIQTEWRAVKEIKGIYVPRVDIAVGPFATKQGVSMEYEYDLLTSKSTALLNLLLTHHNNNVQDYLQTDEQILNKELMLRNIASLQYRNRNARCFLAIEIENKVSRKHLLGGAVNASALGRIGIVVGWTESKVNALVRLLAYWNYLGSVEKNTFVASNLLLLSRDQLRDSIVSALPKHEHQPRALP